MTILKISYAKYCKKCNTYKPLSEFHNDSGQKDKLYHMCKPCARAKVIKWAKDNPDKDAAKSANKLAQKQQRTPKWIKDCFPKENAEFYKMAKELEKVFPWKQHVDHLTPKKGKLVSGLHVPWNLQILSAKENIEKSNKFDVNEIQPPSVSEGYYKNGRVYTQPWPIPSSGPWEDNNDAYHHCGADARKDIDSSTQAGSGNSLDTGGGKMESSKTPEDQQSYGEPIGTDESSAQQWEHLCSELGKLSLATGELREAVRQSDTRRIQSLQRSIDQAFQSAEEALKNVQEAHHSYWYSDTTRNRRFVGASGRLRYGVETGDEPNSVPGKVHGAGQS